MPYYPGTQEFYDQRSLGSHLLHGFLAPTTLLNPFFYEDLYDTVTDDPENTPEFIAEHLFYISPWIIAASTVGMSPFHLWSSGLSVARVVAADVGAFSLSVTLPVLAMASAAGWIATAEHHGAVTPGVASGFGMPMAPTTGGSLDNPLGLTSESLSQWASNMVPGFLR